MSSFTLDDLDKLDKKRPAAGFTLDELDALDAKLPPLRYPVRGPEPMDALDPEEGAQEQRPGVLDDMGRMVGIGLNDMASAAGVLLKKAGLEGAGEWVKEKADSRVKQLTGELSPEQSAANTLPFVVEKPEGGYGFGPGATSPRKIAGAIAGSLPATGTGMGIGMGMARQLIAAGLSPAAAGIIGGAIGEGGTAAAMNYAEVYEAALTADVYKTPEFEQALASLDADTPAEQREALAREKVASSAALQSAGLTGFATAILGAPSGAALGRILGGETGKNFITTLAKQGMLEALQEAPQEAVQTYVTGKALGQYVDPGLEANTLALLEAATGGAIVGAAMGVGSGGGGVAMSKLFPVERPTATPPPQTPPPSTGDGTIDLATGQPVAPPLAPQAAPAPEREVAQGIVEQSLSEAMPAEPPPVAAAPQAEPSPQAETQPAPAEEVTPESLLVDLAAHESATSPLNDRPEPTEAQQQAGNYKKGKVQIQGMDISIENPAGSTRSGTDEDGRKWQTKLRSHYGYFKRSEGADGEQLDVFLTPGAEVAESVYIVDQIDPKTGAFDEHKVVMGPKFEEGARMAYLSNYDKSGMSRLGAITEVSLDEFKQWRKTGDTTKPFSDQVKTAQVEPVQAPVDEATRPEETQSDEEDQQAAKRAIYQAHKDTGAPDDIAARNVLSAQEKTDALGAPMTLWRSESGALGLVPAESRSPFKNGTKVATLTPERGASTAQVAPVQEEAPAAEVAPESDPVVERLPMSEGTEIHVIKNNSGYVVSMMDTDAGKYLPTLRQYRGAEALQQAKKYAWEVAAKDKKADEPPVAAPEPPKKDVHAAYKEKLAAKKAAAEPAVAVTPEVDLPQDRRDFITNKVKTLGSVAAVDQAYAGDSAVDKFARESARGMFAPVEKKADLVAEAGKMVEPKSQPAPTVKETLTPTKPAPPTRVADDRKVVGKNRDGKELFEDKIGVRFYVENGVKIGTATKIVPVRGQGMVPQAFTLRELFNRGDLDFLTAEELQRFEPKPEPAEAVAPKPAPVQPLPQTYGADNKLVTRDRAEELAAKLREKASRLSSGVDPELLMLGAELAVYHLESGARSFVRFSKAMANHLGQETAAKLVPYFKSWYAAARNWPGLDRTGMDNEATVDALDIGDILDTKEAADERTATTQPEPVQQDVPESPDGQPQAVVRGNEDGRQPSPPPAGEGRKGSEPVREPDAQRSTGDRSGRSGDQGTDFVITPEFGLGKGGQKAKYRDNVAAIRTLRQLQEEKRPATPEEQAILARYVGWGGIPQAFDPDNDKWGKEYGELQQLLPEDEWKAARRSTQDAHYTAESVVRGMWDAVRRMGFTSGKVLEPSVGTGNFIGLTPQDLKRHSHFTAVELDPTTAAIAAALYPQQQITQSGFQDFQSAPNYFDLAIGNPPFGDQKLFDSARKDLSSFSIHNYFFAKSLDSVRPGGVLAMVVSNYLMDQQNGAAREYLAKNARLLGAIRLPSSAFAENALTDVTTDVVFLQRLAPGETADTSWTKVGSVEDPQGGEPIALNSYFVANPGMMMGRMERTGGRYSKDMANLIEVSDGRSFVERLAGMIANLPENVITSRRKDIEARLNKVEAPEAGAGWSKQYGYLVGTDGQVLRRLPDLNGKLQVESAGLNGKSAQRVKGLLGIRDSVRDLMRLEMTEGTTDTKLKHLRLQLNSRYDAFVKENGLITDRANTLAFRDDPDFPLLLSLEKNYDPGISKERAKASGLKPSAPAATKADIFTKRVRAFYVRPESADSPQDALVIALRESGKVDMERMTELTGQDEATLAKELVGRIFRDPEAGWVTGEAYLSGNVKAKLQKAREAGYGEGVEALEKVQPPDVAAIDIHVNVGAPWVPGDVYAKFLKDKGLGAAKVSYVQAAGRFAVQFTSYGNQIKAREEFGTARMSGDEIFTKMLNGQDIAVYDTNVDGSRTLNREETTLAANKAKELQRTFKEWIWEDADRRDTLGKLYNEKYNTNRERQYDGSLMIFPGKVPDEIFDFREHQKNVVWRFLQEGRGLADHVVGAGKAQPLDAKVLTPAGWRKMGELKTGDSVIAADGKVVPITGVFPQGEKDIYRVTFSDKSSTECCDEHLWKTWTYRERGYFQRSMVAGKDWDCGSGSVRPLTEIRETLVADHLGAKNHSIPMVSGIEFPHKEVPLHPYLLGVLIGDGTLGKDRVRFSSIDSELVASVKRFLPEGAEITHIDRCDYKISNSRGRGHKNPVLSALREMGVAGCRSFEKSIPERYLTNSAAVRLAVLQGLMDTDGEVSKRGLSTYFTTVSDQLAKDVQFLVQSLGGTAKATTKKAPKYRHNGEDRIGRPAHRVTVTLPGDVIPFLLSRKADKVVPKSKYAPARYITSVDLVGKKEAQCIAIDHPEHLYVTDDFIVTHNTAVMVGAAIEGRRMGLFKKPMFVVPNHLVEQWAKAFYEIYPGANVLAIGRNDFEKSKRRQFMARISTGDWDAVIVAHSSYQFIPPPPEHEARFYREQIEELEAAIREMKADRQDKRTIKQIEKAKERLQEKLKALGDVKRDDLVHFGELGVDAVMVDEADEFKNLYYVTKKSRISGLNNQKGSKKAFDMFVKTRYISEVNGGNGRGVYFATGTPIANSMAEMYHMQRYLDYDNLKRMGLLHFDAWADTFATPVSDWELAPSGTSYRLVTGLKKFVNLPELMTAYRSFTDVITLKMLQEQYLAKGKRWPVPKIRGGKPQNVVVSRSEDQASFMDYIVWRMENMPKDPREDNPLKATSEAAKAALDMRLIDPNAADLPGSKINTAVDNIFEVWQKWRAKKGAQLVFCDLSVPKNGKDKQAKEIEGLMARAEQGDEEAMEKLEAFSYADISALTSSFSVYDDIKQKLIGKGVPVAEIAFIHDANTDKQKEDLFDRVRSGKVRVLIGSTAKMGAGMNVQDRLVALHHLDAPWRPRDLEQREGRIIRQGNLFFEADPDGFEIDIKRYATELTLDARRWQVIETKASFIGQVRSGAVTSREVDDVGQDAANAAEMKASASGNPLILEEITLRKTIQDLEAEEYGWRRSKYNFEEMIRKGQDAPQETAARVASAKMAAEIAGAKPHKGGSPEWSITIGRKEFRAKIEEGTQGESEKDKKAREKRNEEAIKENSKAARAKLGQEVVDYIQSKSTIETPLASYRGFQVTMSTTWSGAFRAEVVTPLGKRDVGIYSAGEEISPSGLITRLDNRIDEMADQGALKSFVERAEAHRDGLIQQGKEAARKLGLPFEQADRLAERRSRHAEVLAELQSSTASQGQDKDFKPSDKFARWMAIGGSARGSAGRPVVVDDDGNTITGTDPADGVPFEDYKPAAPKWHLLASGDNENRPASRKLYVGEINGKPGFSNGHYVLVGEIPGQLDAQLKAGRHEIQIQKVVENHQPGEELIPVGFTQTNEGRNIWFDREMPVDANYFDFIKSQYPDAKFVVPVDYTFGKTPYLIYSSDKLVGALMPKKEAVPDSIAELRGEAAEGTASYSTSTAPAPDNVTDATVKAAFPTATKIEHNAKNEWVVSLPNGATVTVKTGEHIRIDEAAYSKGYGKTPGKGEFAVGEYRTSPYLDTVGIIRLAKEAGEGTLAHEHFHAAMALALNQSQRNLVLAKHKTEEAAAKAYEAWSPGQPGGFFQRIYDFARNLLRLFRKDTVEDVFKDIKSGKVWAQRGQGQQSFAFSTQEKTRAWFSKLGQTIEQKMPAKMNTADFLRWIQKPEQGITRDELEQSGILAEVEGKKTVSKEDVAGLARANALEFEDVVLGDEDPHTAARAAVERYAADAGYTVEPVETGGMAVKSKSGRVISQGSATDIASELGIRPEMMSATHFSQYVEPGAVEGSYRELFVTAPDRSRAEQRELGARFERDWQDGHSQYDSVKNPIVRIRFNERNVDGKRTLFVEEMQGPSDANQKKMPEFLRKRLYDIGVKRVLSYAKENGFDAVSWTPGEMQANRYDLSKQVDKIEYWDQIATSSASGKPSRAINIDMAGGVTQSLEVDQFGEVLWAYGQSSLVGKRLDEVIGKDLAKRILEDPNKGNIEGEDLSVGGEGLKRLYDVTLPALFKKHGKGAVGIISIGEKTARPVIQGGFGTREAAIKWLGGSESVDAVVRLNRDTGNYDVIDPLAKTEAITSPFMPLTDKTPASYPQYATSKTPGMTLPKLWAAMAGPIQAFPDHLRFHAVANEKELPHYLQEAVEQANEDGGAVLALLDETTGLDIYVLANRARTAADVQTAIFHEGYGHVGFRNLLGKDAVPVLNMIAQAFPRRMKAIGAEYKHDLSNPFDRLRTAEEILAQVAERNEHPNLIARAVEALKTWLIRHGFTDWKYTDADLVALIARGKRKLDKGGHVDGKRPYGRAAAPTLKRRAIGTPEQEAALEATMATPKHDMTWSERISNLVRRVVSIDSQSLRQGYLDEFASVEDYEIQEFGELLDAAISPSKGARMTKNLDSVLAAIMLRGALVYRNGSFQLEDAEGGKGFAAIFAPLTNHADGNLLRLWEGWAAAVRASRLIGEGRERNFSQAQIDALLPLEQQYPLFREVFNEYQEFNRKILDMAEATGVIDGAARTQWEQNDYIPFYRVVEEIEGTGEGAKGPFKKKGLAGQRSGIMRLKGGEGKINVIENMILNASKLIDSSFKNVAAQRIIDMTENLGAVEEISKTWKPVMVPNSMIRKALQNAGILPDNDTSWQTATDTGLGQIGEFTDEELGAWSKLLARWAPQGKDIVSVLYQGKPRYFKVNDPVLLRSITNMGSVNYDGILRLMGQAKRLLTASVTVNPAFMLANYLRDTLSTWVVTHTKMKPLLSSTKHLLRAMGTDTNLLKVMAAGGGGGGYYHVRKEGTRALIADQVRTMQSNDFQATVLNSPRKLWRFYKKIGAATESANRLVIFEQTLRQGASTAEAAYQAMDVLNFSRTGDAKLMQFLVQTIPFLNARVQGLNRLYRGAKANPMSFAAKGLILTAASIALMALNMGNPDYEDLPEWDKDLYWHFFTPFGHFRLPKPFEVGAIFATIPERMMFLIRDGEGDLFAKRIGRMFLDTFAFEPLPQLFKPVVEQVANKSFFKGSPIVPLHLQRLQPEAQFEPWTSETLRLIADGMPDSAPEFLRSPRRLEHLLYGYVSSISTYALMASDAVLRKTGDYPQSPAGSVQDLPVLNRFVRDEDPRSTKYSSEFYDMANEAAKVYATIKRYRQQGNIKLADELLAKNADKLAARPTLNQVQERLQEINNMTRLVWSSRTMEREEKQRRVDALTKEKNRLQKLAVERYGERF